MGEAGEGNHENCRLSFVHPLTTHEFKALISIDLTEQHSRARKSLAAAEHVH